MNRFQPQGAHTALVTPFRDDRVDEQRLCAQIDFQLAGGVSGLVPVGTTGESPTLDFEEHERVIARTVEHTNGRAMVIAGVGGNATSEAIRLHRFAEQVGCDAGLSVNPYYNKPTQEGLYRHFMSIADATEMPIVLYNIPGRTGVNMTPATIARLHASGRFPAIKEASGSCEQVSEIRKLCGIAILSGDDALTLPFIALGAVGVVSVLSNIMPAEVSRLVSLASAHQLDDARALHERLLDITRCLFVEGNPGGVKCAMELLGRDSGEVRLPLAPVSESTRSVIDAQLRAQGLRA